MTRILALAAVMAALALQAVSALAAEEKEFKDWLVSCDNLRNCSAYGLDKSLSGGSYLRLERGGAPNAPVKITLAVDGNVGVTFTAKFNDPSLPGLPDNAITGVRNEDDERYRVVLTETVSADMLIASIRKAETINIVRQDPAGAKNKSDPVDSEISMAGAAAALLWMDEQQKRLGTVTALIRKGDKPASAVPPQPKAPVVVAAKSANKAATGKAPAKTDPALIKKGRALCGEEDEGSKLTETWPLGNNQFLYAFSCPDSSGAYNYRYGFLVATGGNAATARAVSFKWPIKIGDLETDPGADETIVNPSFDEKTMILSGFNKGRGLGDCGTSEEWVWDGKSFKLAELKMMGQCRLILLSDWPVLYRAERK
jgi:hypothetical protein